MTYNYHTTDKVREIILDRFAEAVHHGDYKKVDYQVWRQLREAIFASPSSADWYFLCYCETECANTRESVSNPFYVLMVAPNIDCSTFSFSEDDGSLGTFLWKNLDMSSHGDGGYGAAQYRNIPDHIKEAVIDAHNDGIITLDYHAMPYKFYTTANNSIKIDNKEEKNNMFNFDFGPCTHDNIRISMYGIAVKNANGNYASYDKVKKEIVDVDILNFEGGKYLYKMPVAIKDIKVGDVILHNGKPVIVTTCNTDIVAVDVYASEKKIVMPIRNMFGFDFVTKIVSLFDMTGGFNASPDNPFGNILPYMLLAGDSKKGDNKDMLLAMMMMNGGNMDMTKNPMMLYLLLGNGGSKDIDPFLLMMMTNAMGAAPFANTATNATSPSNTDPIVKLPD